AAMVRAADARVAAVAASAIAVAGSAVALAGSRVELTLGLLVVAGCALGARRALSVSPGAMLAAAALAVTAGGFGDAVAGSYAPPYQFAGAAPRLIGLAAIVAGAGLLWLAQRRALSATGNRGLSGAAALVLAPMAAGLVAAAVTPDSGPRAEPVSGFA